MGHLKVSQTLAEIRYRVATGETIREAIESVRMDKLKRLLVSTRRPIAVIAAECGFRNANSLSHRFRNKFGVSLREFRAANATWRKSAADVEHVVWRTGRKRHHLARDGVRKLQLHRVQKVSPGADGDAPVFRPVAV